MEKPNSLRAALVAVAPQLGRDGERLTVWVDKGRVRAPMTADRGFTLEYTLNITVTDFTTDPSVLHFAITNWLRTNQPDLLSPEKSAGYEFEADMLDLQTVDLSISLRLSEQVQVVCAGGAPTGLQYLPEPDMTWLTGEQALTSPPTTLKTIVPLDTTASGGG